MKREIWVNWQFDFEQWAKAVRYAVATHGEDFVAGYVGVNSKTVQTWQDANSAAYEEFKHPRMSNFIRFINAFELDPRDFWKAEE